MTEDIQRKENEIDKYHSKDRRTDGNKYNKNKKKENK